jgi:hypothetical protein
MKELTKRLRSRGGREKSSKKPEAVAGRGVVGRRWGCKAGTGGSVQTLLGSF